MTPKYWFRILLGMVVIFGLGYGANTLFHRGKSFVVNNFPPSLGLFDDGFKLDGDHLGDLQRIQFLRSTPGHVDSAVMTVKLNGGADAHQLDSCIVQVINGHPFSQSTRFECADQDDSASLHLVRFGHMVVLPDRRVVPLYIAGNSVTDVERRAYRGLGGDSGDVDISTGHDGVSISVGGKEMFSARGDSNGGHLVLRGADGHTIIDLHGKGKNGAVVIHTGTKSDTF